MDSFWADKQAIVTGGAGFLGHHVVALLRAAGCMHVFVPEFEQYDLVHEEAVVRMYDDAAHERREARTSIVFHLAGLNGGIGANKARPAEFYYQNIMLNTLVIHYAWSMGAAKIVTAGAGSGYPLNAPQPLKEESLWDGYPQSETAPYALAKRMMDVQGRAYFQQYGLPVITAILGNLYGPYDNFNLEAASVIPALVRRFVEAAQHGLPQVAPWGTGKSTRDFIYVGDAAEALLHAAEVYDQAEVVNVSSGIDTSIRQVVELLVEINAYRGEVSWDTSHPDGQSARRFDVSKAKRDLNWFARTDLKTGLQQTVAWYRSTDRQHSSR
jgi:GDP-L-fucose synthase